MKRIYILAAASWPDKKTGKTVSWPDGYPSDGASGPANDIVSLAWKAHDVLCDRGAWDDGTPCTPKDASRVLKDILMLEGRWLRAYLWGPSTWLWTSVRGMGDYPHRPLHPELAGEMLYVTREQFNRLMGTHTIKSRVKHWRRKRRILRQDRRVLQRNVPYED
jgi:hypothetical protein